MAAQSRGGVENLPSLTSSCVCGDRESPTFRYIVGLLMSERPVQSDCCLLIWLLCGLPRRRGRRSPSSCCSNFFIEWSFLVETLGFRVPT